MDVVVEASEDADTEDDLRADGSGESGDASSGGALSWASEDVEASARSKLDALPGRVVFGAGAAVGSVVTLLALFVVGSF
jgi:hypothetical protein